MLNLDYKKVAETYGGDVRRIAEAAATGALGPNGPILASAAVDFIRRMRAGELQEKVPQTTVAQQLLGGLPSVPPSLPQPGAPAGLGAISPQSEAPMQEAPMPAPEMPVQQEAPMAMAAGGLTDLPVPDDMFDEPTNGGFDDGYAGGGLVAFARGGMTDEEYLAYIMKKESGGRDYDAKGRPLTSKAGAKYAMQVLDSTARNPGFGITPARNDSPEEYNRVGREYALALRKQFGDEGGAAAYNMGPGAYQAYMAGKRDMPTETQNYIAGLGGATIPERNMNVPQGRFGSLLDQMAVVNELYGGLPEDKGRKEAIEYYEKQRSPEEREKARKDDMWATLAQIGASMASTSSPNFLQAVGQAIGDALPGASASRKERKAAEREAVTALSELYGMDRKEAKEKMAMALDLRNVEIGTEEKQAERQLRRDLSAAELASREEDRKATLAAAAMRASNPDKFDIMLAAYRKSYPNFSDVAILKQMKKDGLIGSSGQNMALPGDTTSGNESDNSGMTILGSRPA